MSDQGVLVIEDDPAIRRGVVDLLRASGFATWEAADLASGLQYSVSTPCDLVLLDLVLPGGSGLNILQSIRHERPALPVIILTAMGEETDRVKGLRMGADDYVVKPFSVDELLARVEAVLRRSPARTKSRPALNIPGVEIAWDQRELISQSAEAAQKLSEREADLLEYFARHPDRIINRDELLEGVWQIEAKGVSTRTVDMHVARLRDKLRRVAPSVEVIKTIRGRGYVIQAQGASKEQEVD